MIGKNSTLAVARQVAARQLHECTKRFFRPAFASTPAENRLTILEKLNAECRTIAGQRLNQSGMHWTVPGANAIIALSCLDLGNRREDF